MNKRYLTALSAVLYAVCGCTGVCALCCMLSFVSVTHTENVMMAVFSIISGYFGTLFACVSIGEKKKRTAYMRRYIIFAFLFYLTVLIDFTLLDGGFGRDIFNILKWESGSFSDYFKNHVNLVPFATVRLFIRGYMNGVVSRNAMLENVFGNLLAFMPFALFLPALFSKINRLYKLFTAVLCAVLIIEFLQFLFLTGSVDLDDVILNVSGALIFYRLITLKAVSERLKKLTFGVWNPELRKDTK